jgi:hypothetical protein
MFVGNGGGGGGGGGRDTTMELRVTLVPLGLWGRLGEEQGARIMYLATLLLWASLGSLAVYVSIHTSADERMCLAPYKGISFDMITWLAVFGWTSIGVVAALLLVAFWVIVTSTAQSIDVAALRVAGLSFSFHLAWFIVGSVLYWRTVNTRGDACPSLLRQATFAIWIIECVIFGLWFLGAGSVRYRRHASTTLRF